MRYGELLEHERVLDFRAGVLRRRVHWSSPAGREVRVSSTRLVSLAQRGDRGDRLRGRAGRRAAAARRAVRARRQPGRPAAPRTTTRARRQRCRRRSTAEEHYEHGNMVLLVHRAKRSDLRMAAAMDHEVDGPDGTAIEVEAGPDAGRVTIAADVEPGAAAARAQVPRLRVVRAPVGRVGSLAGARLRRRGAPHRVGRPVRRAARVPRRTSGRAPTSRSTATPSSSRPCGSACSTCSSPARAARCARSRRRG